MAKFENKKADCGRTCPEFESSEQASSREKPLARLPGPMPSASEGPGVVGTGPVEPSFLTIAEVARLLRMSERTVRRRIKDGTLHKVSVHGRLVRISLDELRRLSEYSGNDS